MKKISIPVELGWASPGTVLDLASLELYYFRAKVLEGKEAPKNAMKDTYIFCVTGSLEAVVRDTSEKVQEGDLLEISEGEEYVLHARERAVVLILEA
ncbi:hypothetical protein E3J62_07260 [candidate division TA06 bacterium]|uniref:Cupin domain-containing protein n=1 Tax=candidate division TA06 bacterium TaxID=2250710 RepID=A0A523UT30_UNCT6|nr:MAG: hypothetical protein E3J62_07260 [candidate division TA06 bacterium]